MMIALSDQVLISLFALAGTSVTVLGTIIITMLRGIHKATNSIVNDRVKAATQIGDAQGEKRERDRKEKK